MKTIPLLAITVGTLAGLAGHLLFRGELGPAGASSFSLPSTTRVSHVAANGVVEGARPEVALRTEIVGTVAVVHARENQEVKRGDILVELENELQKEQVARAKAEVTIAKAELDRLRNGERAEKRKAMAAVECAKQVIYQQAEADFKRTQNLNRTRSASDEQVETDRYKMLKAKAEWEQATAERALVEAPARQDELEAAQGRLAVAEARLRSAEAEFAKTRLLAPSDGRVLQTFAEPGELAGPTSAQPVLILADLSKRRVRAFVEELDIAKVKVGQKAAVTADGFPGKEFSGTVGLVVSRMGKRAPQSDAPGEYKDVYYREVLIDLDQGGDLPTNLRVQTRIEAEP
jgi:multidrug resistance efflux pump